MQWSVTWEQLLQPRPTALIRKDMEILSNAVTVRLGSMLMLGLGLLFAALKLT